MAGRGRGRGALLAKLANPGGLSQSKSDAQSRHKEEEDAEIFLQLITQLKTLSSQTHESYHSTIYNLVEKYATSREKLEEVVKLIYDKCLGDRQLCKNGVALCNALSGYQVNDYMFRSELLKRVHSDFKEKKFNRVDNLEKYVSCAIFLCQVFLTMRTKTGELFRPLITPVFEYLQLLLSPESQETEAMCCVRELTDLGELLEHCDTPKMNELCLTIRRKIIDEVSSPRTRCVLLQLLELRANSWERLGTDVDMFYKEMLKDLL